MSQGSSASLGNLGVTIRDTTRKLASLLQGTATFQNLAVSKDNDYRFLPPLELEGSHTFPLGNAGFSIGVGSSVALEVRAFNSTDDLDGDGVVTLREGEAWLKNEVRAAIHGNAGGSVGSLSFGLAGDVAARLLDYRRQQPGDPVRDALLQSLAAARFAIRWEDVEAVARSDDRLALLVNGTLTFTARLTASDVLAGSLAALDRALGVTGAGAFQVDAGAAIEVTAGARDDFLLVFSRGAEGRIAVDVQKATGRRAGVTASLGATIGFANDAALTGLIHGYLAGRLGAGQIPEGIEDRLLAEVRRVTAEKIQLAFVFAYTRIATHETLLSCEAEPAALADLYPRLLLGDVTGIAGRLLAHDPRFVLRDYLRTDVLQRNRSFGVSLRLRDWAIGGTTAVARTRTVQHNERDMARVSLDGRKSYRADWLDDRVEYGFELGAAMENFALEPKGRDFKLTLALDWAWTEEASPRLLHTILDVATVWRIAGVGDLAGLHAALDPLHGEITAELELRIDDDGVRRLAKVSEGDLRQAWALAMAEALPPLFIGDGLILRRDVLERRRIYQDAAAWLIEEPTEVEIVDRLHYPPDADHRRLEAIDREESGISGSEPDRFRFASLHTLWRPESRQEGHRARCKAVFEAFNRLREVIAGERSWTEIEKVFTELQRLLTQPFTARLLGSVLAQLLEGTSGLLTATGTVVPKAGDQAIVIG